MLTLEYLESLVASEEYFNPVNTTMTICAVTTTSGFTVVGDAACVNPAHYNEDIGRKLAREDAIDKLWALEGYLAKNKLSPKEMYERRRDQVLGN